MLRGSYSLTILRRLVCRGHQRSFGKKLSNVANRELVGPLTTGDDRVHDEFRRRTFHGDR